MLLFQMYSFWFLPHCKSNHSFGMLYVHNTLKCSQLLIFNMYIHAVYICGPIYMLIQAFYVGVCVFFEVFVFNRGTNKSRILLLWKCCRFCATFSTFQPNCITLFFPCFLSRVIRVTKGAKLQKVQRSTEVDRSISYQSQKADFIFSFFLYWTWFQLVVKVYSFLLTKIIIRN